MQDSAFEFNRSICSTAWKVLLSRRSAVASIFIIHSAHAVAGSTHADKCGQNQPRATLERHDVDPGVVEQANKGEKHCDIVCRDDHGCNVEPEVVLGLHVVQAEVESVWHNSAHDELDNDAWYVEPGPACRSPEDICLQAQIICDRCLNSWCCRFPDA